MRVLNKVKSIGKVFIHALKGGEANILDGNIDKAIFILAIPMMLEMIMESLFAVVDIYFVSKISVNAVAVVGLTESILTLIYSLAIGLSMGTTAMVARRVGEGKIPKAAIAGVQALYIAFILSLMIAVPGYIFAEDLLRIMGASEDIISEGIGFIRIMLTSNIVIMLLFLINGIFRGAGDAALAMRTLWIANGLNIILDPVLIFGIGPFPELGLEGAAVATVLGRSVGVLYQTYHLTKGKGLIKIHKDNWQFVPKTILKLIKVSAGGTFQFLIASASWILLMRIISQFGSHVLAGYTIAIRIVIFTLLPAWGIANAASTMVGQNLGAKQPDRAEKSVWRTGFYNVLYLMTVMVVYLLFSDELVSFFTEDKLVVNYAAQCLTIVSFGYMFYAFSMVIVQSFNGSGDTRTPTILNFFIFWMLQIPLAYFLSIHMNIGPKGVFWAIPLAESLLAVIAFLLFRRGKWKLVEI